jgi:hypothetical protein
MFCRSIGYVCVAVGITLPGTLADLMLRICPSMASSAIRVIKSNSLLNLGYTVQGVAVAVAVAGDTHRG